MLEPLGSRMQPGMSKLRFAVHACSAEVCPASHLCSESASRVRLGGGLTVLGCARCTCCTSTAPQDPDYPVSELLNHSSNTRGWQSPRCVLRPAPWRLALCAHAQFEADCLPNSPYTRLDGRNAGTAHTRRR